MNLEQKKEKNLVSQKQETSLENFQQLINEAVFTGVQVNYYIHCKTQLWLFSHYLNQENESDLVLIGKLLNEKAFYRFEKNVIIDQKIAIDFIKKGDKIEIHEIKKSNKMEKAHEMQLLYYLYYLKKKGITNTIGVINYPVLRRIKKVFLTEEYEKEIEETLRKIKEIISMPVPPEPIRKPYCKRCAYYELCWSD